MKYLLLISLVISVQGYSQWKNYIISVNGDTLNRVDRDNKKQGPWSVRLEELRGEPGFEEQGYYENDKKQGKWVRFSLMGDKIAEENYKWGALDGKVKYYTRTGALIREESWRAIEPGKNRDTVDVLDIHDPTKVIDRVVVEVEGLTVKHGTWTYYDPEWGSIIKSENWWMDKLKTGDAIPITAAEDDELKPLDLRGGSKVSTVTKEGEKKEVAKPQTILDFEKKNSGKKKVKVRDGRTGGGG